MSAVSSIILSSTCEDDRKTKVYTPIARQITATMIVIILNFLCRKRKAINVGIKMTTAAATAEFKGRNSIAKKVTQAVIATLISRDMGVYIVVYASGCVIASKPRFSKKITIGLER